MNRGHIPSEYFERMFSTSAPWPACSSQHKDKDYNPDNWWISPSHKMPRLQHKKVGNSVASNVLLRKNGQ